MYHLRRIKVLLAACLLAGASLWAQDTKITISSATATSEQSGEGASLAIDGNTETFWHSQWSWGAVFDAVSSVDLTIALSEVTLVDYVRYIPRQDRLAQGCWGEVEVFYSPSTSGTEFTSIGTFQLGETGMTYDFYLNGMEGVECGQIKFTIRSGGNNHATAAEIEAYQLDRETAALFEPYFEDNLYSQLKAGVTSSEGIADAEVKALVENLLGGADDYKRFRVGEYEPYMTTATVKSNLRLSSQYNNYENPTGIYLEAGQSCYVAVSGIGEYPVRLKIKDWYLSKSESSYMLHDGLNYITATTEGNVFVGYYTDEFEQAPNVKVHFINAPVLGYWDSETMENEDWVEMLAGSLAKDDRIIITRSEHAQLAYPIGQWKQHNPTDIKTTMEFYQQVQWAERDMLGLEQYDRQVKNRQLFYGDNSGSMAAGGDAAFCGYSSLEVLMVPDAKNFDFWGVGHEWGHNNQVTPGFKWTGCGETTNNIYASWAQFHFTGHRDADGNPTYLRLEDEVTGVGEYAKMRGGRMQTYFEEGLRKGIAWQLQDGPDYHAEAPSNITVDVVDANGDKTGETIETTWRHYDHFVKLVPFWQLNLWGTLAGKSPEIIQKVIESIRTTENYGATYNTNGKQQTNWMKLACDETQINLLPFFEKAGMLRPIHAVVDDYAKGWNIITEEMIAELKTYVAGKGYPAFTEEINYINGHNYRTYRDNLKLNVTAVEGAFSNDKVTIQHSVAQNAVAFETYNANDELIRITMYGLGSDDSHSYTQVLFPSGEGANYIMAVGYDGERQKVYQERDAQELQALIAETEALVAEVGEVSLSESQYKVDLKPAYSLISTDVVVDAYLAILSAQEKIAEGEDYTVAYQTLQKGYDALSAARQEMDRVNVAKASLLDLIDRTDALINTCGSVTYTPATSGGEIALQTTSESERFYLSTNAIETKEGAIENLLDNDNSSFFHSAWSWDVAATHYLQVDMGDGYSLKEFTFSYQSKKGPYPYAIEVYGSADASFASKKLLGTFSKDDAENALPTSANTLWTSSSVLAEPAYRFLRFEVTKSGAPGLNANPKGEYCFEMSEFVLTAIGQPESYAVALGNNAGGATEELMLAVYKQNEEAQEAYETATTVSQVEKAIDMLQAQYDALDAAKNSVTYVGYTISTNVDGGGVVYRGQSYTATLNAPSTLTAGHLTAISLDGYVAKTIAVEGTAITVIYNKVYTVQVVGGRDKGCVRYNGTDYTSGQTFDALQSSFTEEDLTAVVPDGYTKKGITVDHEKGIVTVSFAAIPLVDTTKYYTLACRATDHATYIRDNGTVINGRSAEGSLFQFEAADEDNGYYIKSHVSGRYLNCTANDNKYDDTVVEGEEKLTIWTMEKPTHTTGVVTLTAGYDKYLNNNAATAPYLQAKYHDGGPNSGNACSLWTLTEGIPLDRSEAYNRLYNYYTDEVKVASSTITGGSGVGYYPVDAANAYNTAYGNATTLLESTTATDDEYTSAYNALVAANEALVINMPEEGKFYTLVSACTADDRLGDFMYADTENNMKYAAGKSAANPEALWTFTSEGCLVNLQTGCSVIIGGAKLGDEGNVVDIKSISVDGQVLLTPAGSNPLHASGGNIISWGAYTAGSASAWRIVEVEDMSLVNFVVNVGMYEHTSLYLNYPVTIPDGVKAYIIDGSEINIDDNGIGTLKLKKLEGKVLPAQTAVIVEAPQGEYRFNCTTEDATDNVENNLLTGSAYVTYREAVDGHRYYIFGVGTTEGVDVGVVGLYKNFVEYTEAGVYAEEGSSDATHYRMSANKVLFDWYNSGQQVNSFRFSVEDDATGIDNIGADGTAVFYDLYGRRILEVVSSGLYIINGEKRYVRVK